ncbi:21557_t:CDS:2, partial [Dentiscutata erythropus]
QLGVVTGVVVCGVFVARASLCWCGAVVDFGIVIEVIVCGVIVARASLRWCCAVIDFGGFCGASLCCAIVDFGGFCVASLCCAIFDFSGFCVALLLAFHCGVDFEVVVLKVKVHAFSEFCGISLHDDFD